MLTLRPIPDDLCEPPGRVGEICRIINGSAIYPQPVLVLGNVLSAVGAVLGHRVCSETDLRTNLYAIGVAPSGSGKNHSRQEVKKMFCHSGLLDLLGGEEIASDAAILKAMESRPVQLMQLDEIGHLLHACASKNAASYQSGIPATLMKLFTSANSLLPGKVYATRDRVDLFEPHLCIYGTSVADKLYSAIRREELEDGLLGRFLVFPTQNSEPEPRDPCRTSWPTELLEWLRSWHDRTDLPPAPASPFPSGNIERIGRGRETVPLTMPFEPDAKHVFDQFGAECRAIRSRLRGNNGIDALWSRAVEQATKIAMIVGCGCSFAVNELHITQEQATYATRLVLLLVNNLCFNLVGQVHRNEYERDLKSVRQAIDNAGEAGMGRTQIIRRFQSIQADRLNEILNRLVEAGDVVTVSTSPGPHGGRPGHRYVSRYACCITANGGTGEEG